MSFLIRRNLPLAWAGWYDSFDTYGVGALKRPWRHLGDGTPADFNALGELHIPTNYNHTNGGGESYEWMPFTPHWGFECEIWFPVEGLLAQRFSVYFTDSWSRIGAAFQNVVGVSLSHAPGGTGETVQVAEFASIWSAAANAQMWNSPIGAYYGQYVTLRVWVENDEYIRVWLNGSYAGSAMVAPGFKFGPRRRCARFLNAALCDVWMRWIQHYDKPSSVPAVNVWVPQFSDNFTGTIGSGWTQIGTGAGVLSDSWAVTGTTDGSRGLLRNTGVSTGRVRIEATVGGAVGPNNTASSGLVLCSNAAGTSGLIANVIAGQLGIGYFSDSLSGNPPTFTYYRTLTTGVTVAAGDKIAFSSYGGLIWIEINGAPRLYAVSDSYIANTYAGLRVSRASSTNSASWNDVAIYTGLG
ncbi:hypothetical protein [Nocardia sp. NPDC003963]